MIFFMDADIQDKVSIIESNSWRIEPNYSDDGFIKGYVIFIDTTNDKTIEYTLTTDSYKRLINAFRGDTTVKKIYLCRNKVVTVENGL